MSHFLVFIIYWCWHKAHDLILEVRPCGCDLWLHVNDFASWLFHDLSLQISLYSWSWKYTKKNLAILWANLPKNLKLLAVIPSLLYKFACLTLQSNLDNVTLVNRTPWYCHLKVWNRFSWCKTPSLLSLSPLIMSLFFSKIRSVNVIISRGGHSMSIWTPRAAKVCYPYITCHK
jgi:hypothetical protein